MTTAWPLIPLPVTHRALQSQLQVAWGSIIGAQLEEECRSNKKSILGNFLLVPADTSFQPHNQGHPPYLQLSPPPHSQPCPGPQFTALLLILFPPAVLSPLGAAGPPRPGMGGIQIPHWLKQTMELHPGFSSSPASSPHPDALVWPWVQALLPCHSVFTPSDPCLELHFPSMLSS